jgi:4-carboxymuconolactone decarboxylase
MGSELRVERSSTARNQRRFESRGRQSYRGRPPPGAEAEDEASLYDLIQELLHNRTVSDSTYAKAVSKFGEQAVVDAVSISGYYTMVAMLLNTARTPLAPGVTTPLPAFR